MSNSKIAILARPRSGSTSLYELISEHLKPQGFECIFEPYNPNLYVDYYKAGRNFDYIDPLLKYDKLLIKTLFGCKQYPHMSTGKDESEFSKWMLGFFEKIIVLDRKDKKLQAESLLANFISGKSWHVPKIYEIDKIEKSMLEKEIKSFTYFSSGMLELANDNNLPVFYYEDLYIDHNMDEIKRIFDYLEIEMNEKLVYDFIISDERKVRIDPH
jgi:hypothetical protein